MTTVPADAIPTLHLRKVLENHTLDMTNRVVAITGTTSGTGYVLAREVARKGGTVLLLNRASERAESSLGRLRQEVPDGTFEPIVCDLQDLDSVRSAAAAIRSKYTRIDVLCNNAGVMAMKDLPTKDGYDVQMQTNSISHFLLTKELFDLLRESDDARIVNHTSMARVGSPLAPEFFGKNGGNLGGDGTEEENAGFSGPRWQRYHQSKLANATFTYGLHEKLSARGIDNVKALLAHPGFASTNLQVTTAQTGGMDANPDFMSQAQSAEDGAAGIIRACMDPEARSGDFFGPLSGWTGFPERLPPEDLLSAPHNIEVNWAGCEAAAGAFDI